MGQVYWTWRGEVKLGEFANFKLLVARWNGFASKDPNTLFNVWTVSEDSSTVRVEQRFIDADAALAQFDVNDCWKQLDKHLTPSSMYVSGDYGVTLDYLREHGAIFMQSLS